MLIDDFVSVVSIKAKSNITWSDSALHAIYGLLFCWLGSRLVEKVNRSIGQDPDSPFLVGVLDIYGFESFKFNR